MPLTHIYRIPSERAERLLSRIIPKKEWTRFQHHSYILHVGKYYDYAISPSGVALYKKGTDFYGHCGDACLIFQSHQSLPCVDGVIMRYLWIKGDERGFLKTARPARNPLPTRGEVWTWLTCIPKRDKEFLAMLFLLSIAGGLILSAIATEFISWIK